MPPAAPPPADATPRLLPDATVTVTVRYPACNLARSGTGPLPPGLVGLDRRQVARAFEGMAVAGFAPERLELVREGEGCPTAWVTLLDRGGLVTAVSGRPGDLGPVVERTNLPVRALSPAHRARLERGLVVPASAWRHELEVLRAD